jgi:hypothetical protein
MRSAWLECAQDPALPAVGQVRKKPMMRKQSAGNEMTVLLAVITVAVVLADIVRSGSALY